MRDVGRRILTAAVGIATLWSLGIPRSDRFVDRELGVKYRFAPVRRLHAIR